MVLQVHADAEKFDVVGLDPTRHGFTSIKAEIGDVTPEQSGRSLATKGVEVDPAPLRPRDIVSVTA